jgi:uncharacterized protein YjbI with pentapeptide repeats
MAIDADFGDAELCGVKLDAANLGNAILRFCNFAPIAVGSMLNYRINASLHQTKLEGADLTKANLAGANFSEAQMRNATLRGANLEGAALLDCELTGADLRDAKLDNADTRGAIGIRL